MYREDVISLASTTMRQTFNRWDTYDQGDGRYFVYLNKKMVMHWDGNGDHRDVATEYTYATTTGNLTQEVRKGEVTGSSDGTYTDVTGDTRTRVITYAASSTSQFSLPASEVIKNNSDTKVAETRFYYDNLSSGSITKGNVTKEENWIESTSYASTTKAYDGTYGLVTSETDPESNTTSFTYDGLNLYVATSTNALSQDTERYYDYATGKVTQTTDPNNRTWQFTYDPVGRLTEKKVPDPTSGSLVTQSTITYTDNVFPTKQHRSNKLSSATSTDIYTYFDGFGRTIQERTEFTDSYVARDKVYGDNGLLNKESLPYFSSGTAWTTATTSSNLLATYSYDALNRVTSVINSEGTESYGYDQWTATTTDRNGNAKGLSKDAHGNLSQVTEKEGSDYYITAYEYDPLNNLTKITDALGNIRNFDYDGLSRRTAAGDLHAPADTPYGTTTYSYDLAGNISSTTDPKSQTISYTYDAINRVLTEDYTGAGGTEITHEYDTCTDGVGRLCIATTTDAVTTYAYNPLGLVSSETKNIDDTDYTTAYAYDRQGNITTLTYPDTSLVKYDYDSAGLLDTITRKPANSEFYLTAVSDLDYAPTGAVTFKRFGNEVTSTYTYNASELYRLSNILTVASTTWEGEGPLGFLGLPSYAASAIQNGVYIAKAGLQRLVQAVLGEENLSLELLVEDEENEEIAPTESTEPEESEVISNEEVEEESTVTNSQEVLAEETVTTTEETAGEEIVTGTSTPAQTVQEQQTEPEGNVETGPNEGASVELVVEGTATTTESGATTTPSVAFEGQEFILALASASTTQAILEEEFATGNIRSLLKGKSAKERATIKGKEIAKIEEAERTSRNGYDIQIVRINPIEDGVAVFVKAWWPNGEQMGFGPDGTVDIERFVIINPPILVPDANGDIVREWVDEDTGELKQRKLREDPKEALLQVLEHTARVKKEKFGDDNIVEGKVGNTTLTVYPNSGTGTAPIDGLIRRNVTPSSVEGKPPLQGVRLE